MEKERRLPSDSPSLSFRLGENNFSEKAVCQNKNVQKGNFEVKKVKRIFECDPVGSIGKKNSMLHANVEVCVRICECVCMCLNAIVRAGVSEWMKICECMSVRECACLSVSSNMCVCDNACVRLGM